MKKIIAILLLRGVPMINALAATNLRANRDYDTKWYFVYVLVILFGRVVRTHLELEMTCKYFVSD